MSGTQKPGYMRSQLTAIVMLCLAAAIAPQAVAQVCGPNITLIADQWRMVGVPCDPGANNTIGDVFGPSLGAANYGVTWIAWKYVYDAPQQCAVASGPADCYTKLALASTVSAGDAFWIYTTQQVTLDYSSIVAATPGPYFEFPAKTAQSNTTPRYYMFANPYGSTVNWADLRFTGSVFGFPVNFSTQQATGAILSLATANVHYWNGSNTYYTRSLTSIPAATFVPKEAAWLEMLQGLSPFVQNLMVQVPKPNSAP